MGKLQKALKAPLVIMAVLAVICLSVVAPYAQKNARSIAASAAVVYVSLRSVNAFLSVAQEVEVEASFIVGGSLQPLKVLEPLDDAVERVSNVIFWVMLAAAALAIATGPVTVFGLGLIGAAICVRVFAPQRSYSQKLGQYGMALGIALPVILAVSIPVATLLTQRSFDHHSQQVAQITGGFSEPAATLAATEGPAAEGESDGGLWSGITSSVQGIGQGAKDTFDTITQYRETAIELAGQTQELLQSYIALLGIFVFRVFAFPLLMMLVCYGVLRHTVVPSPAQG